MKKRMVSWIALAVMLCVLTGCGAKVRMDSPEDQVYEADVKAYIQEILDSTAVVDSFEKKSSDRDDDALTVTCYVSYSGDNGSNQGIFTLSYRSDGTQWVLEKCKVELETTPEPTETECDASTSPDNETSANASTLYEEKPEVSTPGEENKPTEPLSAPPVLSADASGYLAYYSMSDTERQAFVDSFDSLDAFFAWQTAAKADYEAEHKPVTNPAEGIGEGAFAEPEPAEPTEEPTEPTLPETGGAIELPMISG